MQQPQQLIALDVRRSRQFSTWSRTCTVLIGIATSTHAIAAHETGDPSRELLEVLAHAVPKAGAVHVQCQSMIDGSQRVVACFDYATGALYKAFATFAGGVDTTGARYAGEPRAGGVVHVGTGGYRLTIESIDTFIPGAAAWDILHHPDLHREVTRADDGYRVHVEGPSGSRHPWVLPPGFKTDTRKVIYHFDRRGRLRSVDTRLVDGPARTWEYEDERVASVGVATIASGGTRRRIDFRHDPAAKPADFTQEAVERLAVAAVFSGEAAPTWFGNPPGSYRAPAARSPGAGAGAAAGTAPSQPKPVAAQRGAGWSMWWVIVSGGALVVGGFLLKRRIG